MNTKRVTIKNRRGLKLVIQVDSPEKPSELVFIAHGRGGFIEQVHIQAFADIFLHNGFRVVRFDATHSIGESEGDMLNLTQDSYVEDLEDVIDWAQTQQWFQKTFSLCGHSMGAQSTAWYAEHHPEEIKYLAPLAPMVNQEMWLRTMTPKYLNEWQQRGYVEEPSRSKPGVVGMTGWGAVESLKKFDLLPLAGKLTMPVLLMVGQFDKPCPYENQKILFDLIPGNSKKLYKIIDAEHSFRNHRTGKYGQEIEEVKAKMEAWLKEVMK